MEPRARSMALAATGGGGATSSSFQAVGEQAAVKTTTNSAKARGAFLRKYERPGLMGDELEEMKEAFDLFDMEGTGRVAPRDVQAAIQSLG